MNKEIIVTNEMLQSINLKLKAGVVLVFEIKRDEYYEIIDDDLNVNCYAESHDLLIEELKEEIRFLWDAYAIELDCDLTPKARELKNKLLETFEEIS